MAIPLAAFHQAANRAYPLHPDAPPAAGRLVQPTGGSAVNTTQTVRRLSLLAAGAALALVNATGALAADKIRIGWVGTLSGPSAAVGIDIRDGFNLALKHLDGKFGGLPVEVLIADDQLNPEAGKQHAERLVRREKVDFLTGTVFSNIVLAIAPTAIENKTFFIGPNAGPANYSGAQCNPFFFISSWPSEAYSEAGGEYLTQKGYKRVAFIAPNYQGGKDSYNGLVRYYKTPLAAEIFSKLGQLDYAAELAQIRAARPEAVYAFLPGGMGINFVKQFVASGMSKDVQLVLPSWSADQDIIRAVGDSMLGVFNVTHWSMDADNPTNKRFVADFDREYKRLPTGFASQGYDTALLIDSAVRRVKGDMNDKEGIRRALRAADIRATRGEFRFNNNQFPVQNYYLQVVGKGADGRLVNKTLGTVLTKRGDVYSDQCKMK